MLRSIFQILFILLSSTSLLSQNLQGHITDASGLALQDVVVINKSKVEHTHSDANIGYSLGNWRFGISVENIFDTEWEETQFATNSRLQNEAVAVEEIHFTPGTPRFIRGQITYRF